MQKHKKIICPEKVKPLLLPVGAVLSIKQTKGVVP